MRKRRIAVELFLAGVLGAAFAAGASQADGIVWHESFEEALGSAQTSHKPMVVCAFRGHSAAYKQMVAMTFASPEVIAASQQFECFALDITLPENEDLLGRLRLGPVEGEALGLGEGEVGDVYGAYPITVFLDHEGTEHFRRHGSLPPTAFAGQLNKAHRLIECLAGVADTPNRARAHRELGRAYMEMDIQEGDPYYKAVTRHLERAIELDPDNVTGANFDARVDLTIFRIPNAPEEAFARLFELQSDASAHERRFEIQYYLAVAQCAMGNAKLIAAEEALGEGQELSEQQTANIPRPFFAAAAEMLMPFYTDDERSPYYGNEWTPEALALLYQLRPDLKQLTPHRAAP